MIVIIHEAGHVFFCKLFGVEVVNVELYPFGGITKVSKLINYSINKELIIAMGGVIFQLVFSFFIPLFFSDLKDVVTFYNKVIIGFNLLPIMPLDGSIIFRLLMERIFSYKLSFKISVIFSLISLGLFIAVFNKILINNLIIVLFLIFKLYEIVKSFPYTYNKFLLERYIYDLEYNKIVYLSGRNINLLSKDKYYYFKNNNKCLSEKKVLKDMFDK